MGISSLFLSLLMISGTDPDSTYKKFEKENVANVRKVFTFEYPAVVVATQSVEPVAQTRITFGANDTLRVSWDVSWNIEQLRDIHSPDGDVKMDGFRVQLYAGSSYESCNKVKGEFIMSNPDTRVYSTWNVPHFRVRAGDFLDHNEALRFLNKIKEQFPGAFVVPDKIEIHKKLNREAPEDDGEG